MGNPYLRSETEQLSRFVELLLNHIFNVTSWGAQQKAWLPLLLDRAIDENSRDLLFSIEMSSLNIFCGLNS